MDPKGKATSLLPALPSGSRILVLRLRSIGDIVLLTPALRLLKEWRPDLRVSVLIESRFRELLEENPDLEDVLGPGEGAGWKKITARFRATRALRQRNFSLCLNLHGGPTSAFLTRFSGARWRAGFIHFRSPALYHFRIPDARTILNQPTLHTAEHQASAFFWLGMPRRKIPGARLLVGARNLAWWREKRATFSVPGGCDYAILQPTALYATKQWAAENFARLGAYLEGEARILPIYSCGPGESQVLDQVERAAGSQIRRLEDATLGEFAAALAGARVFLGNDSGPAHMAAALGRPSVVVFGSSSSRIWGPWPPQGLGLVVQNSYECNPCPGDRCYRFERPECILSVTFEQVRSALDSLLGPVSGRPLALWERPGTGG